MKRFVVMLDDLVDILSNDWPVSLEDDDIKVLQAAKYFENNPIVYSPREKFRMRFVESKSLAHVLRPNEDHKGAIYERL